MKRRDPHQWVKTRNKDPYVIRANKEGYRARSAYKLLEIDKKIGLIKKTDNVLDLGSAPGSWLQVVKTLTKGKIVGIDLLEIKPIQDVILFQGDIQLDETEKFICEIMKNENRESGKFDVILSDIAPNTTGKKDHDHLAIMNLAEMVIEFIKKYLKKHGNFCIKLFDGREIIAFTKIMRELFDTVKRIKPDASHPESSEFYLIGINFKGITNIS